MKEALRSAQALREDFDHGFTLAPGQKPRLTNMLAVRVGGEPYALELAEVLGLYRDKATTEVIGPWPELLGMAGFRGVIVPVYDLATLLGHAKPHAARWLVLTQGDTPLAFAFETFEAHLQVEDSERSHSSETASRPYLAGALVRPEGSRGLIRIASLVEAILARVRSDPEKGQ